MIRRLPIAVFLVCLLLLGASRARAREDEPDGRRPRSQESLEEAPRLPSSNVTKAQALAIRRGLAWLAKHQNPDWSWNEEEKATIAVTSLVLMALMANGNTETRGLYSENVREGVKYLLRCVEMRGDPEGGIPLGYIHLPNDDMSRMHGHGYATTVLALAYGMGDDQRRPQLRKRIELAVDCIERSQDESGGWGYLPDDSSRHEGSVTVCQIQALRTARDAGFKVNKTVIDKAFNYLVRSHDPETGGFCYNLTERKRQTYALTAAALSTLFGLAEYRRTAMIRRGLSFMSKRERSRFAGRQSWFFYGSFYAAQAIWQASADERFAYYWEDWWPKMRDYIVDQQSQRDGAWIYTGGNSTAGVGTTYSTAMCTLVLEVPLSILPIFQR